VEFTTNTTGFKTQVFFLLAGELGEVLDQFEPHYCLGKWDSARFLGLGQGWSDGTINLTVETCVISGLKWTFK
jgi:hypothetical protein